MPTLTRQEIEQAGEYVLMAMIAELKGAKWYMSPGNNRLGEKDWYHLGFRNPNKHLYDECERPKDYHFDYSDDEVQWWGTELSAAWELVQECETAGYPLSLCRVKGDTPWGESVWHWEATFRGALERPLYASACGEGVCVAISRAYLLAMTGREG